MKLGFYPKLAMDGIRKNRRMYVPYLLTCAGMAAMFYILAFLCDSPAMQSLPGAESLGIMLRLGTGVIAVFACIFLFYTNSFLMRRRKKEFGLYNILGMSKRNLARVLFWETLISAALSLAAGLASGVAFSKLAELVLVRLALGDTGYSLSVSPASLLFTAAVFGVIFLLILLNSLRQVHFSGALALLQSEQAGERPPKGNALLGLAGLALLGGAYYIAVSIEDPISALTWFFLAVLMVIVATYIIMVSGSIVFCRFLQSRKSYYYKPNHFVSTASMRFRMKRNGAGLASICVLATMVLVMLSSTTSLYFGTESALLERYPRGINVTVRPRAGTGADVLSAETAAQVRGKILDTAEDFGAKPANILDYRAATVYAQLDGGDITTFSEENSVSFTAGCVVVFTALDDYNAMTGESETLEPDEALAYMSRRGGVPSELRINGERTLRVKRETADFAKDGDSAASIIPTMTVVVSDLDEFIESFPLFRNYVGVWSWHCGFDTGLDVAGDRALFSALVDALREDAEAAGLSTNTACRSTNRADFYALYGGFLFLGITLSVVFVFAAVLIIYYKQISEGYEDEKRFGIMQKVGMTKREIRKSINSQLLTVFFLPLGLAVCHLAFAFPMIRKLLMLFNLTNSGIFLATTGISLAVFAVFYTLVYKITSNAYYNIVSGVKRE